MKKSSDPRHKAREELVQELFSYSFEEPDQSKRREFTPLALEVIQELPEIDGLIAKAAPEWPLDKIAKLDLAILRLAVFELKSQKEPPKVIIDEAVELGKSYGGETTGPFVNGVLGTIHAWMNKKDSV